MEKNLGPTEALSTISDTRGAMADKLYTPWWYHPALGFFIAWMIILFSALGSVGTPDWSPIPSALTFLPIIGILALPRIYQGVTGIQFVGKAAPDAGPRGRRLQLVLTAIFVVGAVGSLALNRLAPHWTVWVLASVVGILTIPLGRAYDRELRSQIRSGQL